MSEPGGEKKIIKTFWKDRVVCAQARRHEAAGSVPHILGCLGCQCEKAGGEELELKRQELIFHELNYLGSDVALEKKLKLLASYSSGPCERTHTHRTVLRSCCKD